MQRSGIHLFSSVADISKGQDSNKNIHPVATTNVQTITTDTKEDDGLELQQCSILIKFAGTICI